MQDVRQSVYDVPYTQAATNAETLTGRSFTHATNAEALNDRSFSHSEHQAGLRSQAAAHHDRSEAGGKADWAHDKPASNKAAVVSGDDVAQGLAGMDVRQSMYDSPHHNSDASYASQTLSTHYALAAETQQLSHVHAEYGQALHASAARRRPGDESLLTQHQEAWEGDSWQPQQAPSDQAHDADLNRSSHCLPMSTSADASSSQAYWEDQSQLHSKPMPPSQRPHAQRHQHVQCEEQNQDAQHLLPGQGAQHEHQRPYAQQTQGAWQAQPAQLGQHAQRAQHSQHAQPAQHGQHAQRAQHSQHAQRAQHSQRVALQPQHPSADARGSATYPSEVQKHVRRPDEAGHAHRALVPPSVAPWGRASSQMPSASRPAPDWRHNGWDKAEKDTDINTTASQVYDPCTPQAMTHGNASSSLDSEQEAAIWEMVNEEPNQDGLSVSHHHNQQQQQRGHSSSRQGSRQQREQQCSQRFPPHGPIVSSRQSSHQSSYSSSRASSAHSVGQVKHQQYRHRPKHLFFLFMLFFCFFSLTFFCCFLFCCVFMGLLIKCCCLAASARRVCVWWTTHTGRSNR